MAHSKHTASEPLAAYSAREDGRADLIFAYSKTNADTWVWSVRGCTNHNSGMVYWNSGLLEIDQKKGTASLYGFDDVNASDVSGDIVRFECTNPKSDFEYQAFSRHSIAGEKLDDDAEPENARMKLSEPIIKALTACMTRLDHFYEVNEDDKWNGYFIKKSVLEKHGTDFVDEGFEVPFYNLTVQVNRAGTFISLE